MATMCIARAGGVWHSTAHRVEAATKRHQPDNPFIRGAFNGFRDGHVVAAGLLPKPLIYIAQRTCKGVQGAIRARK